MRKKNFHIMTNYGEKQLVRGFLTSIKIGELKFGVAHANNGKWQVTELSTGWAIPHSQADTKEESVKKAITSIAEVNQKYTYIEGVVQAVKKCYKQLLDIDIEN